MTTFRFNATLWFRAKQAARALLLGMLALGLRANSQPAIGQLATPSQEALAELDNRIEAILGEDNTPGALVAIFREGEIVHLRSYGLANVELGVPVSDSTVFEIGSISKQFVSAATLLLVEAGSLQLEDPIHEYLPYLPGEWVGVTIRQLLSHTSGIPDYEEIRSYDVYRLRTTPEDVIRIAQSRPVDFRPGQGWYYSNTGYYLMSMILERVEGKPLGDVLRDRIFAPLGMSRTRFADPESIIKNRAAGYWENKVGDLINRNPTETSSTLGAGGLLTSVGDMAIWDHALYGEGLLSNESKTAMWTPDAVALKFGTSYGLGWGARDHEGMKTQRHNGQVAGFSAQFVRYPEERFSTMFFFNRYRGDSSWDIGLHTLHTYMPDVVPLPN